MAAGIIAHQLTKRYGKSPSLALDGLSFTIQPGEVYGFLGANGAGKSTTIRLLMNFIQPTSGSASIAGFDSVRHSVDVKRHTGYLAGDIALYLNATGQEVLDYLSRLQGGVNLPYRKELEKRFEAELHKPIRELSKGNRQKIGIIQACMHQPDVLILDEPTSGLDPLMQEAFYETISEAKLRGSAVLMSSHNLAETQRVCDRVGIVKHGKLIREETITGLSSLASPTMTATFKSAKAAQVAALDSALSILQKDDDVTFTCRPTEQLAAALQALAVHGIVQLKTNQPDLEDEFLDFYGDTE